MKEFWQRNGIPIAIIILALATHYKVIL